MTKMDFNSIVSLLLGLKNYTKITITFILKETKR